MCKARRYGDQYHCHACGFQWDVDDEDRPMCKTGNGVSSVVFAVALCVSGVASADGACDASHVADLTTSTLVYAEACSVAIDQHGYARGSQSKACQLTSIEANRQFAAAVQLKRDGCTSYYAGPTRDELKRLRELSDKFGRARSL